MSDPISIDGEVSLHVGPLTWRQRIQFICAGLVGGSLILRAKGISLVVKANA